MALDRILDVQEINHLKFSSKYFLASSSSSWAYPWLNIPRLGSHKTERVSAAPQNAENLWRASQIPMCPAHAGRRSCASVVAPAQEFCPDGQPQPGVQPLSACCEVLESLEMLQGAGIGFWLLPGPAASDLLLGWGKCLFSLLPLSLPTCSSWYCYVTNQSKTEYIGLPFKHDHGVCGWEI